MRARLRRALAGYGLFELSRNQWQAVVLVVFVALLSAAVYADGIPICNCKPCIDGTGDWWYCWVFSGCCLIFPCP